MIATTAALARYTGRTLTLEQIREIAQNVEAQLIRVPTGCQDYYPALYGGVSAIHLDPDGLHREAIAVSAAELEARAVLVYTGVPRQSGINNWEVFKAHIDGNRRVRRNFQKIVEIAQGMAAALAGRGLGGRRTAAPRGVEVAQDKCSRYLDSVYRSADSDRPA